MVIPESVTANRATYCGGHQTRQPLKPPTRYRVAVNGGGAGFALPLWGLLLVADDALTIRGTPGLNRKKVLSKESLGVIELPISPAVQMTPVKLFTPDGELYPFKLTIIRDKSLAEDLDARGYRVNRHFTGLDD